jgi:hypothetical protein
MGYTFFFVSGDILPFLYCNLHCPEMNKGTCLYKLVAYQFEHITKQGGMYVIVIPYSQPD